jgi:hypothetical protein
MLYKHATTVGLALALLGLASTGVFAQDSDSPAGSTGVVATITALDARTGMATLQTEAGEVVELPKYSRWTMGDKVLCDRIEGAGVYPQGRLSRLQNCRLWQVHAAGDAATRTPATRPESRGASATEAASAADNVRFLATPNRPEPGTAPAGRRALAVTVEMTCTQQQETLRRSPVGAHAVDTTCIMAKGPDGQEVPIRVSDSRVGHTLHCTEQAGKITCPNVRIPAFEAPTGVTR